MVATEKAEISFPMDSTSLLSTTHRCLHTHKSSLVPQYDAGAYVTSVASSLVQNNYNTGAYVASVASSLVHNMMLELT